MLYGLDFAVDFVRPTADTTELGTQVFQPFGHSVRVQATSFGLVSPSSFPSELGRIVITLMCIPALFAIRRGSSTSWLALSDVGKNRILDIIPLRKQEPLLRHLARRKLRRKGCDPFDTTWVPTPADLRALGKRRGTANVAPRYRLMRVCTHDLWMSTPNSQYAAILPHTILQFLQLIV
jgi:hypothetical protein